MLKIKELLITFNSKELLLLGTNVITGSALVQQSVKLNEQEAVVRELTARITELTDEIKDLKEFKEVEIVTDNGDHLFYTVLKNVCLNEKFVTAVVCVAGLAATYYISSAIGDATASSLKLPNFLKPFFIRDQQLTFTDKDFTFKVDMVNDRITSLLARHLEATEFTPLSELLAQSLVNNPKVLDATTNTIAAIDAINLTEQAVVRLF